MFALEFLIGVVLPFALLLNPRRLAPTSGGSTRPRCSR